MVRDFRTGVGDLTFKCQQYKDLMVKGYNKNMFK